MRMIIDTCSTRCLANSTLSGGPVIFRGFSSWNSCGQGCEVVIGRNYAFILFHHLAVLNDDNLCSCLLLQRLNRLATLADDSRHQVPRHLAHQDKQLQTMFNNALSSPSFRSLHRRSHPPLDHHRHHLEGLHGIPVQEYG